MSPAEEEAKRIADIVRRAAVVQTELGTHGPEITVGYRLPQDVLMNLLAELDGRVEERSGELTGHHLNVRWLSMRAIVGTTQVTAFSEHEPIAASTHVDGPASTGERP